MDTSLIPLEELKFLLRWLHPDLDEDGRETVDAVLELANRLATDTFLPHYKQSDQDEPWLDAQGVHVLPAIGEALGQYADAGFFAAGFDEDLGGLGLSSAVSSVIFAQFAAANIATSAYAMLTAANARLLVTFGSAAQIARFAVPLIHGRWFGTMCLSEPQAGSSLADIRTRAVADESDELGERYRLTGNKMWISGGDQDISENIVHLVLAKIPSPDGSLPEGTEGISLFIVPKFFADGTRNDLAVAGLNHKMGYRGTANCLLNLGETDGAQGWLVGEPGRGLAQMFHMMNEARIAVGIGAAALGMRGYRLSVRYAQERLQGRPNGMRGGDPVAIIQHPDVRRMLLAQKSYAEGALALCLFCARLVDHSDDDDAASLLALLTPVAKTWSSEYGLAANDLAIQIHGGYGYTRDFDVEQLYRDNRLNPIHEGTTGIQAADLLGRKILREKEPFERALVRVESCVARASTVRHLAPMADTLRKTWVKVGDAVEVLRAVDRISAMNNATHFLWAFGHAVMAWIWLETAVEGHRAAGAGEVTKSFANGKLRACRYFYECELPKIPAWLGVATSRSDLFATGDIDEF